ncbi:MAG: hypothetical protein ACRDQH_06070 [Pseudonocardiaceae bacterium]
MRRYRLLTRAFPPAWRKIYGEELLRLLGEEPPRRGQSVDLVFAGARERWHRLSQSARAQVETLYRTPGATSVMVMFIAGFVLFLPGMAGQRPERTTRHAAVTPGFAVAPPGAEQAAAVAPPGAEQAAAVAPPGAEQAAAVAPPGAERGMIRRRRRGAPVLVTHG